jgi:hypothetical protein
MQKIIAVILLCLVPQCLSAQIAVEVDAGAESKAISPYLYGRNNSFSSTDPNGTLKDEDFA